MGTGAVIEVLGRDGHVRLNHRIESWPLRIGRSPDCDLVLDDVHLAGVHAELRLDESGPQLALLPSLNGGWQGPRRLHAGEVLSLGAGALFQLGSTSLRLRRREDALAPEQPLLGEPAGAARWPWLLGLLLLWLGLLGYDQWLALDPGASWTDYRFALLVPVGVMLVWAAAWGLVSQLFQHRFPFGTHLRRALTGVIVLHVLSFALPLLAYAFSARVFLAIDALSFPAGIALLVWWHASLVWPRARRQLAGVLLALLLGGLGLMTAKRLDQQYWFGPPYLSVLPPPSLRLVAPKPPEALLESLRPLEAELARQARRDNEEAGPEAEE